MKLTKEHLYDAVSQLKSYVDGKSSFSVSTIKSNTDLNDYQETGFYQFIPSGGEQTVANKPTLYPFFMVVGKSNDTYQIIYDNNGNMYTRYLYDGIWSDWEEKTIKLEAEIKDINKKIEDNKIIVDSALSETSTNPVQNKVITEKLNEVFQSVSNGKTLVASAITDKGITTEATDTFEIMAENIGKISGISGGNCFIEIVTPNIIYHNNCTDIVSYTNMSSDYSYEKGE